MSDIKDLKDKSSSDIKCRGCGGPMEFNPANGALDCIHCNNTINFASEEGVSKQPFDNMEKELSSWNKESVLTRCTNCGAKEVVNSRNMSHICPFCGSSKVVDTYEEAGLKPNGVLPFTVTEKQATANFMKWLKKKWFTPNDLKSKASINNFGGVYTPTWSYDSQVKTVYKGVLERSESVKRGDRWETEIIAIPVRGTREDQFLDVLVPVGQKIDRVSFKNLEPFKFGNLKIYDTRFLAGFVANHYHINATEAWKSAMQMMKSEVTNRIVRRHNADRVRHLDMDITHDNKRYSYLLLPIWVCNYFYHQKLYNFFINGNTGKVTGKVPRSAIKILMFILFIMGLLGTLMALGFTGN